ncbi:MAG: MFS transporter [Kamptonema sp. SIO4C4]|nr:MFS transporter [Kamptonema sp. SIO4C4]
MQTSSAPTTQHYSKFILLTSLYTSQFLPSAFFFRGLPVFMRQQDTSLEVIGLLGLLTLPWMLKFLWAPLVDLYGWTKWGHYKSWIVATQSLLAIVVVACANLNASENAALLFGGVFLIVTLAATQDIATDALAFKLLAPSERGWGNGIQSAGRAVGGIIGGGVMLLILNQVGWHRSLWILAAAVLLALFPLLKYREPEPDRNLQDSQRTPKTPAYFTTLLSFFHRPGVWHWLFFIWLYVTGTSIASSMFRPLLVDAGLSLADIGWMVGIVGSGAAILGSLLAGGLIQPLGRRRALVMFGLLQAVAVLALILPAMGITQKAVLYAVSSGELFARSLTSTALFTVMMDKSRRASAGSDYTLQSSAYMIGHHVGIPAFSGFIASIVGYTGVFSISFLFCLMGVWLATKVKCD